MRHSFATPPHIQERFDRAMALLLKERGPEPRLPTKRLQPPLLPVLLGSLVLFMLTGSTEGARDVRRCIADDRYLCGSGTSVFGTPYQPIFEPLMPKLPRKFKQPAPPKGTISAYKVKIYREAKGVSLKGVVATLANKAREISAKCGSRVVSAVARRPNRSNHPIGRAVDMQGNPKCMYALLKKWPGGVSYDYAAVRHVHFSYNPRGMEWGVRFAHRGYRTRLARASYRG